MCEDERCAKDIFSADYQFTDKELLDWLQLQLDRQTYTGKCIFRWSFTGRGWRLHETEMKDASCSVRQAIIDAIRYQEGEYKFV